MLTEEEQLNRLGGVAAVMLELDLLLPFFDEVIEVSKKKLVFQRLLEQEDPELWVWFSRSGKSDDAELQDMVEFILARVQPE